MTGVEIVEDLRDRPVLDVKVYRPNVSLKQGSYEKYLD